MSRAGAPPQGMSWLTTIVVSFLGTISISLTWQGGETWLLFNNLSHFDDFTPYLVCPDLTTTSRRRSSGDWMKTLEDHVGHRGLPLIPELEMVISFWSLPARSRPLYLPLQVVDQGGNSADMLATLLAAGQSWDVQGYAEFIQESVRELAELMGSSQVGAASHALDGAARGWVVFVERSLRKEFLERTVPDESMEHAIQVSQGAAESSLLPSVEGVTDVVRQRRALFNELQRLTPLLRLLMGDEAAVSSSDDRALHRSEWVGTGVQYFYDCHLTGFFTGELLPLLWDDILARGDHDFALAARV